MTATTSTNKTGPPCQSGVDVTPGEWPSESPVHPVLTQAATTGNYFEVSQWECSDTSPFLLGHVSHPSACPTNH